MVVSSSLEIAGKCPNSGCRIVKFGACEVNEAGALTARDEYLTIGQQCCGVVVSSSVEATSWRPSAGSWVVEFGGRDLDAVYAARASTLLLGKSVAVCWFLAPLRLPVNTH